MSALEFARKRAARAKAAVGPAAPVTIEESPPKEEANCHCGRYRFSQAVISFWVPNSYHNRIYIIRLEESQASQGASESPRYYRVALRLCSQIVLGFRGSHMWPRGPK